MLVVTIELLVEVLTSHSSLRLVLPRHMWNFIRAIQRMRATGDWDQPELHDLGRKLKLCRRSFQNHSETLDFSYCLHALIRFYRGKLCVNLWMLHTWEFSLIVHTEYWMSSQVSLVSFYSIKENLSLNFTVYVQLYEVVQEPFYFLCQSRVSLLGICTSNINWDWKYLNVHTLVYNLLNYWLRVVWTGIPKHNSLRQRYSFCNRGCVRYELHFWLSSNKRTTILYEWNQ